MRRRTLLANNIIDAEIDVSDAVVGDVVFYNPLEGRLIIRREEDFWREDEEPVGIVVIPASHNVYGNGACGVMALMSASYSTPDKGSTSLQTMYWGQWQVDVSELFNYDGCSSYGDYDTWTAVQLKSGNAYLPSDQSSFGEKLMNKLSESDQNCWYYFNNNNHHAPSPYLNDGSRNPDYYNTTIDVGNVLSDFKGKENTEILISKHTGQSNWKTASSITNNGGSDYSPSACVCWRYSTAGTKQGDWYLPAMGELGYAHVRYQKINDTISTLQTYFGKTFRLLSTSYLCWSSSEYSSVYAWSMRFLDGGVLYGLDKSFNYGVRPFMQLKPEPEVVDMGLSVDWATCNLGANSPEEYGYYFQWGGHNSL